ncbi:MAG: hypothetical protein V3V41_09360 [Candidatus Heimdallarchaeota archaeon]
MADVVRGDNKELQKDLISSLIDVEIGSKEKFLQKLEKTEEKVQESIDEIIDILHDHIPKEFLIQSVTLFENLQLLLIVKRINRNKHFTRNQIAINFLAILDNLLASIFEQLSQVHFDLLKHNMQGFSSGKSFSYNEMKKKQMELIQRGYITKIRKLGYTLKLKDKYCHIVNHMATIYPQHSDKIYEMEIAGYELVHSKSIPKIDTTKSAAVIIGTLISSYFTRKEVESQIWKYLVEITNEEEEKIKKKVYRFKSNLKKENETNLYSYTI